MPLHDRTVYPYLSILFPRHLGTVLQGWLNAFEEGGWLPKWGAPGYKGGMVGSMGDNSFADAIVKGVPGFNTTQAYAAIRRDAFTVPQGNFGRAGLAPYLAHGYIPAGALGSMGVVSEEVSRTLNYALSDFAIANAAEALGHAGDAAALRKRAKAAPPLLFENKTGFFRSRLGPRNNGGAFVEPFDEFAWHGGYTEAGPWQYRFYTPQDPAGLRALYAGADPPRDVCDVLDEAQTLPGIFHVGGYGQEIHEQTEMALLCWGQYEHDNQPVHHMLYMFAATDPTGKLSGACAQKGQAYLRRAMRELYKPGPAMFCGDEDNGEFGAWLVLSALGLYSLAPGDPAYTLGSPMFAHARVALGHVEGSAANATAWLDVVAEGNARDAVYVRGATWNGVPVTGVTLPYAELMKGGTLNFSMSPTAMKDEA